MAKNIEPKLRKIKSYLQLEGKSFIIPEYQRAYSWRIENCDKLWQDILNFMEGDSKDNYFFGTIIVNCQDNDEKLYLIDGQQRTTSFLLLLKALLLTINGHIVDLIPNKNGDAEQLFNALSERRKTIMSILYGIDKDYVLSNPKCDKIDNEYIVLENHSINERDAYKEELNKIIKSDSYETAENNVIKIPYARKDNKYTNYFRNFKYFYENCKNLSQAKLNDFAKNLLESCEVIEIRSWQVEQAITMFNSLNSDGLPLYDSDIISAKLYAMAEKKNEGATFTEKWKQLLDTINNLSINNIGSIDSILMQKMYYERAARKEITNDKGSINVTTPGLRRYYTEKIESKNFNEPIVLCNDLIKLAEIWEKIYDYSIIRVLLKFNENSKLFLASYLHRFSVDDVDETKIYKVAECLLRLFALLEIVDIGYSSNRFKTFLFGEELKLVDKNITESEIENDFNNHIAQYWDNDSIDELIKSYNGNALIYLNEFLYAKESGMDFTLGSKYDIEHIMPYSGMNHVEIQKDAGISSTEEFKAFVNKIGNKILLEEKINRAIGNEWFRTKVSTKVGNRTGYMDSKYPLAHALVEKYKNEYKPYWTKDDILKATDEASKRITQFILGH